MAHQIDKNSIVVKSRSLLRIQHGLVSFEIKRGVTTLLSVRDAAGDDMLLSFETNAAIQVACERAVTVDGNDHSTETHVASW